MQIEQCPQLHEFNRIYKELGSLYYEVALKAGVTDSAFWTIYAIMEMGDGCFQKDVAEHYSISKQTISSAVRGLEKKGYITLKRGKGRNMHLLLTDAGKAFAHEKVTPLMEMENSIYEAMSFEESKELLRLSQKYNDIFREKMAELLKQGE